MDPWDSRDSPPQPNDSKDPSLHLLLSTTRVNPTSSSNKRIVYPAVPFMTVKAERKCLSEIRSHCGTIPENFILSNGMRAEDFALMYVLGHQLKRKDKQTNCS